MRIRYVNLEERNKRSLNINRQRCKLWAGVVEESQEGTVVAREKIRSDSTQKTPTTVDIILVSSRVSICAGHNYGD